MKRVDDSGGDVTRSRFGIGDDDDDRSRVERTGEKGVRGGKSSYWSSPPFGYAGI